MDGVREGESEFKLESVRDRNRSSQLSREEHFSEREDIGSHVAVSI